MRIILATCSEKAEGTKDDQLLVDALKELGTSASFAVWNDSAVNWRQADAVIIRSTWDYHFLPDQFIKWAQKVSSESVLINPLETIQWNISKTYFKELEMQKLPIVRSILASDFESGSKFATELMQSHSEIVIKPAISASADLTFKIFDARDCAMALRQVLKRSDAVIQPYIPSIETLGEISLIYLRQDGRLQFSHAVQKIPKSGDFRVQADFGGSVMPVELSDSLILLGHQALARHKDLYYARVDLVDWQTSPKIGEIELIEPELFFRFSEEAAIKFAKAFQK